MGQRTVEIDEKTRNFVQAVKTHYPGARIVLFGSRARGDFLKESDYDFIIVSKAFAGIDFTSRITQLLNKADVRFAADILCYTPQEFEKKKNQIGTVQEAVRQGIPL